MSDQNEIQCPKCGLPVKRLAIHIHGAKCRERQKEQTPEFVDTTLDDFQEVKA